MKTLEHRFVEFIPNQIEEGVLYISINYRTAVHNCICGCGNKVVTPITPNDWKLTFDGKTITLHPSIGNWQFECRSHYFITNNKIVHARKWDAPASTPDNAVSKKNKKKKRFLFW